MRNIKFGFINIGLFVKDYLKLFVLILCSVVGVGFISGAEIVEFFVKYGFCAYIGLLVFSVLVFFVVYKILLKTALDNDVILNKSIVKNNYNSHFKLKFKSKLNNISSFFNVYFIAGAMFSGLKHLVNQLYGDNFLAFYFLILMVFIMLILGVKWLSKIGSLVLIFVVFMIIYFFCNMVFCVEQTNVLVINNNLLCGVNIWLSMVYATIYVFMNFFQIKPIILASRVKFNNKKNCFNFSLIFAVFMFLTLFIFITFLLNNKHYLSFKMPFLEYFICKNTFLKIIFSIGLLLAIGSTLISCLIGVKECLKNKLKFNSFSLSVIVFIICFAIGFLDFSFYVKIIYPMLGVLNIITFIFC